MLLSSPSPNPRLQDVPNANPSRDGVWDSLYSKSVNEIHLYRGRLGAGLRFGLAMRLRRRSGVRIRARIRARVMVSVRVRVRVTVAIKVRGMGWG